MATYLTNTTDLKAVADKIREKTGTATDLIFPDDFVDEIDDLLKPSGTKNITAAGTTDVSAYANASVAAGSEGEPLATKGTVIGHAIAVTPSVTNTEGYISGGSHTGTAVSVSASELVSGTYNIGSFGTFNITNYENVSVPSGVEGTPTATKGTVSGHAVTVTPSVTNTGGYIAGGTHTGTGVSVAASELVSGTYSVTGSGTADVTNYASVSVPAGSATTPATSITATPTISASGGNISASVSASKSITPTVSAGYVASGTAGTASVSGSATVAATSLDANLTAANIAAGVSIFGVLGTHSGANAKAFNFTSPEAVAQQDVTVVSGDSDVAAHYTDSNALVTVRKMTNNSSRGTALIINGNHLFGGTAYGVYMNYTGSANNAALVTHDLTAASGSGVSVRCNSNGDIIVHCLSTNNNFGGADYIITFSW